MQSEVSADKETKARHRESQKKKLIPVADRAAFSLAEFSALFGKQKVWAYKQMYAGRIKVIQQFGVMMVPRSELERINNAAATYSGAAKETAPA